MSNRFRRSMSEPIRTGLSSSEYWLAEDRGLIKCWELGRKYSVTRPAFAASAKRGELPIWNFKGGVEKPLNNPLKYGSFRYLAMWQGLRNEDLDIDTTRIVEIICSRTGVKMIFTVDATRASQD